MPQLDKLIILSQIKFFLVFFVFVYFLFILVVLPKINLTLRIRREKLKNILTNSLFIKSLRIFFFNETKSNFSYTFSILENNIDKMSVLNKNNIHKTYFQLSSLISFLL